MKRLVILAPNWLGDAVMALPAIADVRRGAPDAHVAVAARAPVAPLFQLVPDVRETIVLNAPASVAQAVLQDERQKAKHALILLVDEYRPPTCVRGSRRRRMGTVAHDPGPIARA